MKKFVFLAIFLGCLPFAFSQDVKPFPRGAKVTPFPKIVEAIRTGKATIHKSATAPAQVVVIPKKLSYWGNNQFGMCVTTESVYSMADYSTYVGIDEIFVTEAVAIKWARDHGVLNGAELFPVMQDMGSDGIKDDTGTLRKAGTPSSVDYRNEAALQSAIAQGPLSIAIDADALPSGAGNKSGWYAFGGRNFPNTDHCVSLGGYGPAKVLFAALGVPMPAGIDQNKMCYLLFTWNTIGVVDHAWLLNTCVEAWVRNPTVIGLQPVPPQPQPGKITIATANVQGAIGAPVKFSPLASGGTSPYIFLFEYGDGVQDASGSHAYKAAGSYKVTVSAVDSLGQLGTGTCTASIGVTPTPPGPTPTPGGYTFILPQDTPAGTYHLVLPSDLDQIQRLLDSIRGLKR